MNSIHSYIFKCNIDYLNFFNIIYIFINILILVLIFNKKKLNFLFLIYYTKYIKINKY